MEDFTYHQLSYGLEWTQDQFRGFKDALKGLDIEYKVFEMDTKRKSSPEWKEKVGREARELIESWKPDLVYTNDDNAQEYVTKYFTHSDIPFVFSAVNAEPSAYGFDSSSNICGVLEQEHFVQTVRLLLELKPDIKRIAVIVDDDPTWNGVVERMKQDAPEQLKNVRFISWNVIKTFAEYQETVKRLQNQADALALLGIHTFKNEKGENVPWQEVLEWTGKNSRLPDFSFWKDRIYYGTLCVVYVSGYEQGFGAGKLAYEILVNGKSPASLGMKPTLKGRPIISLARAKRLGIQVRSRTLLSSEVVHTIAWEQ